MTKPKCSEAAAGQPNDVLVVGMGTMGRGIAHVVAAAGFTTRLFDVDQAVVRNTIAHIESATARRVAKGKLTEAQRSATLELLQPYDDMMAAAQGCELVIESVPEELALKVEVLTEVGAVASRHAIMASNTSSLSITELGRRLGAPERTVGMHFFNPPVAMELVELVRGLHTATATVLQCRRTIERLGKTAIVVNDSPGFATSRLGLVLGVEAIRMVETSVASVADIDRGMELGYRHPMGPLKLGDLVGLDVRLAILEHLHRELGEQFRPPVLLRQMVRAGWLGKKTGRGFYEWNDGPPRPVDPRGLLE